MASMRGTRGITLLALLLLGTGAGVFAEEGDATLTEEAGSDATAGSDVVFSAEIEKLLSESSDPEDYPGLERCINARVIRDTEVLDDRHVVFELSHDRFFLVQFQHRCQKLKPRATIAYEPRNGSQLCRLDQIRASSFGVRDMGPPCSIPGFHEVTADQVGYLKETLRARAQSN